MKSLCWWMTRSAADSLSKFRLVVFSGGLLIRLIFVRPTEPREVPAEVQFKVAPNTVADIVELAAA
jgi:hypothetical protein